VLEALNRVGGRIYTLAKGKFSSPVEAGAEFIHGDLHTDFCIIKAAQHFPWREAEGKMYEDQERDPSPGTTSLEGEWESAAQEAENT
jgi:hypothetical protein